MAKINNLQGKEIFRICSGCPESGLLSQHPQVCMNGGKGPKAGQPIRLVLGVSCKLSLWPNLQSGPL